MRRKNSLYSTLLFLSAQCFIFLVLCLSALPVQALEINNVRFGAHPDKTRMVIELSQPSAFRSFILPANAAENKPHRLVIDLPDFEWKAGIIPHPVKTSVSDVRSGAAQGGIKRLVVDLNQPAETLNAFILPANATMPPRLVVDFRTISASAFESTERKVFGSLQDPAPPPSPIPLSSVLRSSGDNNSNNPLITPTRKPSTPEALKTNSSPMAAPKSPLRKPLIVIDAGHGGADPGAIGANKSKEKNITLAAALELKKQLEATGRYKVALTRSDDRYLKLHKRVGIARAKDADLFISLHADSIDKPNVSGASIYTLSNKASDQQTAKLAARENQADLIAGVDLSHEDKDVANILIDLAMRDTMNQSKFFANTVVEKMGKNGIRVLQRPHRYAGFAVLKAPDIPSVLFEMGFMSNAGEARMLATRGHREKIASTLVQSIDAYFQKVLKNNN